MIQVFQIEKGIPLPLPRNARPHLPGSCQCGRMPREGYKTCDKCLGAVKAAYIQRRKQGKCGWGATCPNEVGDGHSLCDAHLTQSRLKIRELMSSRRAMGLCRRCGKREIVGTMTWCLVCYPTCGAGNTPTASPIPPSIRKAVRQFWRLDRIDQRRAHAEAALKLLKSHPRLQDVIALRNGLVDGTDHTLQAVGDRFGGITRERVRQIESQAFKLLKREGFDVSPIKNPSETQRPPIKNRKPRTISKTERRKEQARGMVTEAVRTGKLVRQPCHCGAVRVDAHHPDYSKPLEVVWLCRSHHIEAHGKKLRENPRVEYDAPPWLVKLGTPSSEFYDAPSLVETLKHNWTQQGKVSAATGLSYQVILRVLRGEETKDKFLLPMLRYIETLKQKAA